MVNSSREREIVMTVRAILEVIDGFHDGLTKRNQIESGGNMGQSQITYKIQQTVKPLTER